MGIIRRHGREWTARSGNVKGPVYRRLVDIFHLRFVLPELVAGNMVIQRNEMQLYDKSISLQLPFPPPQLRPRNHRNRQDLNLKGPLK